MKDSKLVKKFKEYEREGYEYMQIDAEEEKYSDKELKQSGLRVIVHIVMEKPDSQYKP